MNVRVLKWIDHVPCRTLLSLLPRPCTSAFCGNIFRDGKTLFAFLLCMRDTHQLLWPHHYFLLFLPASLRSRGQPPPRCEAHHIQGCHTEQLLRVVDALGLQHGCCDGHRRVDRVGDDIQKRLHMHHMSCSIHYRSRIAVSSHRLPGMPCELSRALRATAPSRSCA